MALIDMVPIIGLGADVVCMCTAVGCVLAGDRVRSEETACGKKQARGMVHRRHVPSHVPRHKKGLAYQAAGA